MLGGLIFGIALFRTGVLARWAAVLLAVSTVGTAALAVLPQAFDRPMAVPEGIALIGLGVSLWRTQTSRPSRTRPPPPPTSSPARSDDHRVRRDRDAGAPGPRPRLGAGRSPPRWSPCPRSRSRRAPCGWSSSPAAPTCCRPTTVSTGFPVALVVHVTGAAVFALLGVFQFVPGIRRRHRAWHRRAGRVVAVAGLAVAGSALWLTLFYEAQPGTGELLYVLRLVFGSAMVGCLVLGFTAIRRRDIAAHRAWMIRAYALGLGAGTQVFTEGFGEAIFGTGEMAGDLSKGAAWVINLAVAEWAIRRPAHRRKRRQQKHRTSAGTGPHQSLRSHAMTSPATSVPAADSATAYELRVAGHLDDHWSPLLGDLTLTRHPDGTTTLTGPVTDQAHLHGVLARVRDLGATLLSLRPSSPTPRPRPSSRPWRTRCAPSGSPFVPPPRPMPTPPGSTGGSTPSASGSPRCPTDLDAYRATFAEPARLAATLIIELDGKVIGDFMLRVEDAWAQAEVADRACGTQAELGWVLDPAHTGRGYATEAVRGLLEYCFTRLGVRRVVATCFLANDTSWRLMERLGMRREGHAVAESLHRSGRWLDTVTYAVLADEWTT